MKKKDLAIHVAKKTKLTEKKATEVIDCILQNISTTLEKGDAVRIMGFGTFNVKKRGARNGNNPMTGKLITIPASIAPVFKAGKKLKEIVNGN